MNIVTIGGQPRHHFRRGSIRSGSASAGGCDGIASATSSSRRSIQSIGVSIKSLPREIELMDYHSDSDDETGDETGDDDGDGDSNDEVDGHGEECTPGRDNGSGNSDSDGCLHDSKDSAKSFVSGSRRTEKNNSSSNINTFNHTFNSQIQTQTQTQTTGTTPTTTNRSATDNNNNNNSSSSTQHRGTSGNGTAIPEKADTIPTRHHHQQNQKQQQQRQKKACLHGHEHLFLSLCNFTKKLNGRGRTSTPPTT